MQFTTVERVLTEQARASCYQKSLLVCIYGLSGSNARHGQETVINTDLIYLLRHSRQCCVSVGGLNCLLAPEDCTGKFQS